MVQRFFCPSPTPEPSFLPLKMHEEKKKRKRIQVKKKKNTMINAERHESEQLIEAKVNRPI